LISALALVLLLLVPGLVTLAALGQKQDKRIQLDLPEGICLVLLIGVVVIGWISMVLAEVGAFSLPLLLVVTGLYVAAVTALRRGRLLSPFRGWTVRWRDSALIGALLILAGFLFLRPFEFVTGGSDPGVYVNTGVNIARTGSILINDTDVRNLPAEDRGTLFGEPPKPWAVGSRHIGFYLRDFSGTVEPHGFHLFPVWIAVLYSLGGLRSALYAAPVFSVLAVLALYCLGKRLFNPWVGLLAALFLTINAGTLWFARYPAAEMVTQYLFLAGLWTFLLLLDAPSKPFAILSGLTFGLVHLAKIELFFLPVVLFLYFVWVWLRGRFRREYAYFLVAYLLVLGQAFVHASFIATTYALGALGFSAPSLLYGASAVANIAAFPGATLFNIAFVLHWKIAAGLLCVVAASLIAAKMRWRQVDAVLAGIARHERKLRITAACLVALVLVYGYYVRPLLGSPSALPFPMRLLQVGDTMSLVKLALLTTPLGLMVMGIGLFLVLSEEKRKGLLLVLCCGLAEGAVLLYSGFITPLYFWAARRELPVFLPLAMLCIGYALWVFHDRMASALKWIVPVALGLAILGSQVRASFPFLWHNEYGGAIDKTNELASAFPDNGVLLFEWSTEAVRYATPLQYVFGKTAFLVPATSAADPRLADLVSHWQQDGRPVYWISSLQQTRMQLPGQKAIPLGSYSFVLPEAESTPDRLPQKIGEAIAVFDVYQLQAGKEPEKRTLASAEIGDRNQEGFYEPERSPEGGTLHWTKGDATVTLPAVNGNDRSLVLKMGGARPVGVPHGTTTVYLNGIRLADLVLTNSLRTYVLPVPAEAQTGNVWVLRLETTTWNPARAGVSKDDRDLGMQVQSISVEGS